MSSSVHSFLFKNCHNKMVQALSVLFGEIQFWNQEAYKLCFASVPFSSWYSPIPPLSWTAQWFFQGCPWEIERQRKRKETEWEWESFCWWKWQWHWAYCLVKHTQPPPHAAWPSNRGQWNLLIGSRGPDRWCGNSAETVSFCFCHTQKMGWLQSQQR